jgi:hypothetical protein
MLGRYWRQVKKLSPRIRFLLLMLPFLAAAAGFSISDIKTKPLDFDGSIFLQVARNTAEHGNFASYGALWNGTDYTFEPSISSGPSVILPMAGVIKVFGPHVWDIRALMLLFYLATAVMIGLLLFEITESYWAILGSILWLCINWINYGVPPYSSLRIDPIGEVPAALYLLLSLWFYRRKKPFASGFFVSMAYLAKLIMLVSVPAFLGAMALTAIVKKKMNWRFNSLWAAGFIIPSLAWEIYRFFTLGGWANYTKNWSDYWYWIKTQGSGITKTNGPVPMHLKLHSFYQGLDWPKWFLLSALIALLVSLWFMRDKLWRNIVDNSAAVFIVSLFFGWWLFIGVDTFFRRTVPVVVIGLFVYALALVLANNRVVLACIMAAALAVFIMRVPQHYKPSAANPTLQDQVKLADFVDTQSLPLSHGGFWQNPDILYLTGRHSKMINLYSPRQETLLVLPKYMYPIIQSGVSDLNKLQDSCDQILYSNNYYVACKHKGTGS